MDNKEIPTEEQPLEPCEHMTDHVSAMSDGTLKGPSYWFMRFHLLHCRKCSNTLRGLRVLRSRMDAYGEASAEEPASLTPDRHEALQKLLDEVERK